MATEGFLYIKSRNRTMDTALSSRIIFVPISYVVFCVFAWNWKESAGGDVPIKMGEKTPHTQSCKHVFR